MYEESAKIPAQQSTRVLGNSRDIPTPKEPGIADRLKEMRGYLHEISELQQQQRGCLFAPEPCDPSVEGKLASESIEELAAWCCQHAAMIVSEARSIRNRL